MTKKSKVLIVIGVSAYIASFVACIRINRRIEKETKAFEKRTDDLIAYNANLDTIIEDLDNRIENAKFWLQVTAEDE